VDLTEKVKGEDTQSRKDASAERRSGEVGGVKTPKRLSPSKGRDYVKGTKASIDWWKNRKKVNEGKTYLDWQQAAREAHARVTKAKAEKNQQNSEVARQVAREKGIPFSDKKGKGYIKKGKKVYI